jgi:signal transduction histidine kinase/CheY-like chemotaxis protein
VSQPNLDYGQLSEALYLTQASVNAVLAAVLGGLFVVYRRRFLLHWCGSWGALALFHAGALLSSSLGDIDADHPLRLWISSLVLGCGYLQVSLLLSGTWLLVSGRGIHRAGRLVTLLLPFALGTGIVLVTRSLEFEQRLDARLGIRCLVAGLALLATSLAVAWPARRESSVARWLTVLFFALGGVAHLRNFAVVVGGGKLLDLSALMVPHFTLLFAQLMLVLSLLMWFFEGERRSLLRTAKELSEKEEHLRRSEHLEAVGRLAGGVAHDFNNLLTAITGHAELLLSRKPGGDADREDLLPIARASARAAGLVRELLTFSRRMPVRPRHFAPDRMLREMRHMLERLVGESVRLELALTAPDATLHADPAQIELAILNLVTNGREAMPGGGVLRVATLVREVASREISGLDPGRYFEFAVTDNGCGIPNEALGKVFEPFFTTKQGKGTGLGLASVYGVARSSGGDVRVESQVGRGTTFRVLLPLSGQAPENELELVPTAPQRGGSETILLVEDEPQVRELAQRILARAGYHVLVAENGDVALVLAAGVKLDLLLSDVIMPGLPVLELVSVLRKSWPGLPVLLMSGYSEAHLRSVGLENETPFLAKPFTNQSLLASVRDTLDGRTAPLAGLQL